MTIVVVTLVVLGLVVIVVTACVDLGLRLSATLHRYTRRWALGRRDRRALRRQARTIRRAELTSGDFEDWCEVHDDGEA